MPQTALVTLGGLDILLCCCGLGYVLRLLLQDGQRVPKSWIILGVIMIGGFLGWITALLMDAERLRHEMSLRQQSEQHLTKVEDSVRQLQHLLPPATTMFDRRRWELVHEVYLREHDNLHTLLRERQDWHKQVTQIHEQVQHVHQIATADVWDPHNDALLTRERAQMQLEKLRQDINHGEQEVFLVQRARWHSIGAAALTGVFLMLGCLLPWLVFDRELRRRRRAQTRLGIAEAHFRALVENQPDPVAVVDASATIVYVNSAWQSVFGYQPEDVQGRVFFELIHPEDRPRVQLVYEKQQLQEIVRCRLSADYGVWHDVEIQLQEHQEETTAVRFRNLRETAEKSAEPSVLKFPGTLHTQDIAALVYLYDPAVRRFTTASNLPLQLLGYEQATIASAGDFLMSLVHPEDEVRVFRGLGLRANNQPVLDAEEEIRLRDASGQYQWFAVQHRQKGSVFSGIAFPIQRQKRAEEARAEAERKLQTLTESERQARADLQHLQEQQKAHDANLRDHEHRRKHHEKSLREREEHYEKLRSEHDEHKKLHEGKWREHEHHRKHLEKSLREREEECERLKSELDKLRGEHEEHKKFHEGKWRDHEHQRKHLEKSLREREEHWERLKSEHEKLRAEHEEHKKQHEGKFRDHEHHRKHHETALREREEHYEKLKSEHEEHKKLHEGKWRDHEHQRKHLEKSLREREEEYEKLRSEHERLRREHEEHKKFHEGKLSEHEHHRKHLEKSLREREAHHDKLRSEHEEHKKFHEGKLREHEHHRSHLEKSLVEREEACKRLESELREREEHCRKWEHHVKARDRRHEELEATLRDHQERLHEVHTSHERHARSLQSNKEAMRRLARGVANDFNKILSVVLGYTDVLRESFAKDHLAQNYVDEIRQAANHGAELSQKLLAFSRNHLLQLVPFELNHHLAGLEGRIRDTLGHSVQWHWDRAEEELWVKTDPHPMEQALIHLLAHLRQRMPHGGTLSMETSLLTLKKSELTHADMSPGNYVRLSFHDPANDMDEEARNHLFEPYYSASEKHKSDLSLATANGIIRQSGGCIDVESSPGQGSTIHLLLPWTDERPHTTAQVA